MAPQILTDWSRIASASTRRVCFLVRGMDGGGAQRDAVLMANALAAAGVAAAIVTLDRRGPLLDLVATAVPVLDLGRGGKQRLLTAAPALRRLLVAGRPAALVASEAAANVVTVVAALGLGRGRPNLILREVASPLEARRADPYWQNRLAYRLARYAYPRADRVVTFTAGVAHDLVSAFGVPADKVVALGTNAVVTREMRSRLAATPAAVEPELVVSVGRLSAEKGQATLIEAFSQLHRRRPKARLVILGEGSERQALEALVAARGLAGAVELPGFAADPVPLLRRAALFASASTHEGFGNAIVEALAAGVPVVSTDAPYGPREILAEGRYGRLVPVGDAAALAGAIDEMLATPADAAALTARAEAFSVEAAARRFLEVTEMGRTGWSAEPVAVATGRLGRSVEGIR